MNRLIFCFALFFSALNMNSQEVDESKNFIYKYNGEVVYGNYIDYRTPLFAKNYFLIDDIKVYSREVFFYQSGRGFFSSLGAVNSGFAERIMKGRVNYFEQITTSQSAPMPGSNGFGMTMGTPVMTVTNYYNRGYEPLKNANYKNLIVDLKDNPKSVVYLEKHRRAKGKRITAYVLGGIVMAAGILTASKKTGETSRSYNPQTGRFEDTDRYEMKPVNLVIGLAGFGTIIGTYLSSRKKRNYLRKSIEVYNE